MAARPRTLPAAIAPVLVGTAAAYQRRRATSAGCAFAAALVGSILIQIGTNLANDYSDAKRGADTADRLGPVRVTSAGTDRAAAGPARHLDRVRRSRLCTGIYLATVAGPGDPRRRRSSRSPPASSTRAGRGPTATRAWASSSSSCSSAWSPSTAPTTSSSRSSTCCRSCSRSRSACSRRRSWSSTTSATSTPTRGPASGRWRCAWAASGRAASTSALLAVAFVAAADSRSLLGDGPAWGLLALAALPLAIGPLRAVRDAHRRPGAERRAGRDRRAARRLQLLLRSACCSAGMRIERAETVAVLAAVPRALRHRARRAPTSARWSSCGCGPTQGFDGLGEAVPLALRGDKPLGEGRAGDRRRGGARSPGSISTRRTRIRWRSRVATMLELSRPRRISPAASRRDRERAVRPGREGRRHARYGAAQGAEARAGRAATRR